MSFEATQWMWTINDRIKTSSEFAVLSFLCWKANPDRNNQVWYSQKKIAEAVKLSVATVRRVLAALEARELISRGDQSIVARLSRWARPVVWRVMCHLTPRHHDTPSEHEGDHTATRKEENPQGEPPRTPLHHDPTPLSPCTHPPITMSDKKKKENKKIKTKLACFSPFNSKRTSVAAVAADLVAHGHKQEHVDEAVRMFHTRRDLRHPNAIRFLVEDVEQREAVTESQVDWRRLFTVTEDDPVSKSFAAPRPYVTPDPAEPLF